MRYVTRIEVYYCIFSDDRVIVNMQRPYNNNETHRAGTYHGYKSVSRESDINYLNLIRSILNGDKKLSLLHIGSDDDIISIVCKYKLRPNTFDLDLIEITPDEAQVRPDGEYNYL